MYTMTETVLIRTGSYRNTEITDTEFNVIKPLTTGAKGMFITVDGTPAGFTDRAIRVKIADTNDISDNATPAPKKSDTDIMNDMRVRFGILDDMTRATVSSVVRGLVVTGPPGIGKSFGVEKIVDEATVMNKMSGTGKQFGVEKGAASPIGLYMLLHQYSAKGSLLVLDDSDTILYDELSLNLLKAALDSGKKRRLAWHSESRALEKYNVPDTFEFDGAIIFITNLDFSKARGKIGTHLEALMSRCHYLDMGISGSREKFLRCKQIVQDGMLASYDFTETEQDEILDFIFDNQAQLRELSLRMVKKIADLRKFSNSQWRAYAENTCLRNV